MLKKLNDEYVKSIFVSSEMQSQGIGKILLNYAKDKKNKLHLNVYVKVVFKLSFYGGLKMYDLGGLRTDRC
nr:GNAT family N-acetyltransferase [Ligilactobacillus ruminis]